MCKDTVVKNYLREILDNKEVIELLDGYAFDDFWDDNYSMEDNVEFIVRELVKFCKRENRKKINLESRLLAKEEELRKWKLMYDFDINEEGMIHLPTHGFTVNSAYVGKQLRGLGKRNDPKDPKDALEKSRDYEEWTDRFIELCGDLIPTYYQFLEMGVDLAKPVFVKIGYVCRPDFDILNLDKTLIDTIYELVRGRLIKEGRTDLAKRVDDNKIDEGLIYRVGSCEYLNDTVNKDIWDLNNNGGHIFIKFQNI